MTTPTLPNDWWDGAAAILGALRRWATDRELAGDHGAARMVVEFLQELTATYRSLAEVAKGEADAARDAQPKLRLVETEPVE